MYVKILQAAKSSMQSGEGKDLWIIRPVSNQNVQHSTNHMGWIGTNDTFYQSKLIFSTVEAAKRYANTHGFYYQIHQLHQRKHIKKYYSDNFK